MKNFEVDFKFSVPEFETVDFQAISNEDADYSFKQWVKDTYPEAQDVEVIAIREK